MKPNQHIKDYVSYYCKSAVAPGYAVFIDGPWGVGKTWFVDDLIAELSSDEIKFLKVSLYGISRVEQIEDLFFQQLHPKLANNKYLVPVSRILKNISKNIPVEYLKNAFDEVDLKKLFLNTKDYILIFDDIERTLMPINDVMGYINTFVEHQGYRVIIIGNTKEIPDSKKYIQTKEKLVGSAFSVVPHIEDCLESHLGLIKDLRAKLALEKNKNLLISLFKNSGYDNLRHLTHTMREFERIYNLFPESMDNKPDLVQHVIQLFFIYSFETRHGSIESKDFEKLTHYAFDIFRDKDVPEEDLVCSEIAKKYYSLAKFYDTIFPVHLWQDLLDKSLVDSSLLKSAVEDSVYYTEENMCEWQKILHVHHISEDTFNELKDKVFSAFTNGEIDDVGALKHVVGFYLWLSDNNLYEVEVQEVLDVGKENIERLKSAKTLKEEGGANLYLEKNESYKGHCYFSVGTEKFREFCAFIDEKLEEVKLSEMPAKAIELLDLLETDDLEFNNQLTHSNDAENKYCEEPILAHLEPKKFVDKIINLNPKNRNTLAHTIKKRYEIQCFSKKLLLEKDFWIKVKNLLEDELTKMEKTSLNAYMIKKYILSVIEGSINVLEQINISE